MRWLQRLRFATGRWLIGEMPQDHMVPVRGSYLYIDFYRQVWRLRPTGDPSMPLRILAEER